MWLYTQAYISSLTLVEPIHIPSLSTQPDVHATYTPVFIFKKFDRALFLRYSKIKKKIKCVYLYFTLDLLSQQGRARILHVGATEAKQDFLCGGALIFSKKLTTFFSRRPQNLTSLTSPVHHISHI